MSKWHKTFDLDDDCKANPRTAFDERAVKTKEKQRQLYPSKLETPKLLLLVILFHSNIVMQKRSLKVVWSYAHFFCPKDIYLMTSLICVTGIFFIQRLIRFSSIKLPTIHSVKKRHVLYQSLYQSWEQSFPCFFHDQKMDITFCQDGQFLKCRNKISFLLVRF